jgi:beta-lactamase regulating signal transducer with metallopeptidase domain
MTDLASHDVQTLGWTLLHFLWQGAALAVLFAIVNATLRDAAPPLRYLLASATLLAMLAAPLATFASLQRPLGYAQTHAMEEERAVQGAPLPDGVATIAVVDPDSSAPAGLQRIERWLPALVALWGAGVLLLSLRTLGGWALVQGMKRSGLSAPPQELQEVLDRLLETLRVRAPVRLYQSALVKVPTALGWLRPVVLLPASALTGLTTQQLELVLAHELAHVRRLDYLVNLLQSAAETLLFYHPAVWWVSGRMRVEREHCCDDVAVLACGGNRVRYARALADLQGLCSDAPAMAMAASGGSLLDRISRLVAPPRDASPAARGLAGLVVVAALASAVSIGSSVTAPKAIAEVAPLAPAAAAVQAAPAEAPKPAKAEKAAKAATPAAEARPAPSAEPRAFPIERILELAQAGVTPEYIDEMDAATHGKLSVEQLINLRAQGVGPDYVEQMARAGYPGLGIEQLLSLRSQGVSPDYAKALKAAGLGDIGLQDLLALRSQGVSPEYVAEMKKAGYADLSIGKLIMLRSQGVTPQYAAEMKALGFDGLMPNKLVALRTMGVTPSYVRELTELGLKPLSVPVLMGLRGAGVTPEWIRGLQAAGFKDLPVGALVELRAAGVTPEWLKEMRDAGFTDLKAEDLARLRASGVGSELVKRMRGRP